MLFHNLDSINLNIVVANIRHKFPFVKFFKKKIKMDNVILMLTIEYYTLVKLITFHHAPIKSNEIWLFFYTSKIPDA
jgi:hypothetical protein